MRLLGITTLAVLALCAPSSQAIMERGDHPWNTNLRSFYDDEMKSVYTFVPWLLNLGPTGIRARIYPDRANLLVVKYVFQDARSPARGKVEIEDVIAGANGKLFTTFHRFGRRLPGGGGWDGPMMELARHIEDSQGKDGVLNLVVWPKGDRSRQTQVPIQLRPVGRFAKTFPYDCARSRKMLEELCDFMVLDYESSNWKKANSFYGGPHGRTHQLLALMASGMRKYEPLIEREMAGYFNKRYDPAGGGFQTWTWGFDGIVMGEYYHLTKDPRILPAIQSVGQAMPLGCWNGNGIYTHRSALNLAQTGRKPYASIAAISGLQMIAMSLFKSAGLPYDEDLYHRIYQHYLNSARPEALDIAYAFSNANRFNPQEVWPRHAIIKLKDPSKGLSGKGPGFICPTGMKDIGEYEIIWPTRADPRWKPTDWVAAEAATNIVTELKSVDIGGREQSGVRRVDRNHPAYRQAPPPAGPYRTSKSGGHLAPVGMGALALLIANEGNRPWTYLGTHAANTCVLGPNNAFDGHASANLAAFWSILGAAQSDRPRELRAYLDYMKTFLILSETHNGGLIHQPWGRDRPGSDSDPSYGPRILPTATGAILLSLGQKRLFITGKASKGGGGAASSSSRSSTSRPTRKPTTRPKGAPLMLPW